MESEAFILLSEKMKQWLNQPITGYIPAVIIGTLAIIFPAYLLRDTAWQNTEQSPLSIIIAICYIIVVAGFVYIACGKRGPEVTSNTTDQKVEKAYSVILKKLTPLWLLLLVAWLIWLASIVLKLL